MNSGGGEWKNCLLRPGRLAPFFLKLTHSGDTMKRYLLIATTFLSSAVLSSALAQQAGDAGSRPPRQPAEAKAKLSKYQNQLRLPEYQNELGQSLNNSRQPSSRGVALLDEVYILGLEPSADNVEAVRALLASNVSFDEKVSLTRILARFYSPQGPNNVNEKILSALRGLIASGHKDLGREAMYAYSRTGYFPDSIDLLTRAKNAGYFADKDYHGELAHLLPYAPEAAQNEIMNRIASGREEYASDILALTISNPEQLKRLPTGIKERVMQFLAVTEPKLTPATGAFSMSEGVRFTYWLHAMATLSEATSKTSYVDFVNRVLHDPSTDPRKIMFFFVNSEGRQVIATYGGKSYESLLPKISRYSAQHPANQVMRDTVAEVSDLIKTASR
jgi:hypothetical protein